MKTVAHTANPVQKHRREVRYRIVAPVLLAFGGLVAVCAALVVAVAAGSMEFKQVTIVMSAVATVFIALPMAILCLVPYVLFAAGAWGMGKVHATARKPLGSVRRLTGQIAQKTNEFAPRLARPTTAFNVRVTRWEQVIRIWLLEEKTDE